MTGSPSTPATAPAKSSSSSPPTPQGMQKGTRCTKALSGKKTLYQELEPSGREIPLSPDWLQASKAPHTPGRQEKGRIPPAREALSYK